MKCVAASALAGIGMDRLFRYVNRNKLLVVMYHGVTQNRYAPPVWTQLPVETFRAQIEFLASNYRVISLGTLLEAIRGERELPRRAALITFDDGLKNNRTVAFPLLKERGLPAAIFLSVDFIGTSRVFWFDRLYLVMREAAGKIDLPLPDEEARRFLRAGQTGEAYALTAETLKRCGRVQREAIMKELSSAVPVSEETWREDFGLLDWSDVRTMQESGLIDFGVHTATHRILTELGEHEWHEELHQPRLTIREEIGSEIRSFCYPNGHPGRDFQGQHKEYLKKAGYLCAFSTESALFEPRHGDPMAICRVPAGNDDTSLPAFFRLNSSGTLAWLKQMGVLHR